MWACGVPSHVMGRGPMCQRLISDDVSAARTELIERRREGENVTLKALVCAGVTVRVACWNQVAGWNAVWAGRT